MQLFFKRFVYLLGVALLINACSATPTENPHTIEKKETLSFEQVAIAVGELEQRHGASELLIVLDIDNTLLTSSGDLGGDIWYQWQRDGLSIKPSEPQKVTCLFEDSIGLLYELAPMHLTEDGLPALIKRWQDEGITLMALTSRAPKYRAATERELHAHGIDLEPQALAPKGQKAPLYREKVGRELSYMKGIMMTSGMNKGTMLDYILDKTKREFDAIVFVDDSIKNIDAVFDAYKKRRNMDTRIFHYTKVEHDRVAKYGAVLTQEQATAMHEGWQRLNAVLGDVFPERNLREGCLSVD